MKARVYGHDESKYRQKMKLKAEIIVGAANRLWGMRDGEKKGRMVG